MTTHQLIWLLRSNGIRCFSEAKIELVTGDEFDLLRSFIITSEDVYQHPLERE